MKKFMFLICAVAAALLVGCGKDPLAEVRSAAERGDADAQYELCMRYSKGDGVAQDLDEALNWGVKAIEQGHEKAFMWLRDSAEQGFVQSQYRLGWCYYESRRVPKNHALSVKWWTEAAKQGHVHALYDLAGCYYYGDGTEQD